MTEELQTQPQASPPQQPKQRLNPQDFRNQDLVTKLMAATPPYLYSPAIGPHNFFFSEMLRSLVQNKRNENFRNAEQLQMQQQQQIQQSQAQQLQIINRRPRKRSWSQQRPQIDLLKETKDTEERPERPLELTNKQSAFTRNIIPKFEEMPKEEIPKISEEKSQNITEPPAASLPPSDLILPPPPPVWYPPLYPPYGIDPLHFFIDLRVSGHIYDRKKQAESQNEQSEMTKSENNNNILNNNRHGSAFSVPKPREVKSGNAINLSSNVENFDDSKFNIKNTNYVMQNLPRIYSDLNSQKSDEDQNGDSSSIHEDMSDEQKYKDNELNVISDEDDSIEVNEN